MLQLNQITIQQAKDNPDHNTVIKDLFNDLKEINTELELKLLEYKNLNESDIIIEELPEYLDENFAHLYPKAKPIQRIVGKISLQES